ncbi:MAG: hypothetical protein ACOZNI_25795 [Myxococcota bacterium]
MFLSLSIALAADPRVWLETGFTASAGVNEATEPGGGFAGGFGVALGKEPARSFAFVARAREGLSGEDLRHVGNLGFTVRYPADRGPWVAAGLAHNHETPADVALRNPVGTAFAVERGITHRTGFEVGAGWDFAPPFPEHRLSARVLPRVGVSAVVLPDAGGPPVYVVADAGIRFGLDRIFRDL